MASESALAAAQRRDPDLTFHGRYHVNRELNRGATAVVYEAMDMKMSQLVALKVLYTHFEGMNATHDLEDAQREVEIAQRLSGNGGKTHPNICALLDVFFSSPAHEKLILVFQLVDGVDLLDLLNQNGGRIPEPRARRYARHLLSGIKYIHATGLAHRDIKPENCMIERRTDRLKIIDFGLSKQLTSARTLMVGTPDYMPPEMLTATPVAHANSGAKVRLAGGYDGTAVDVWSAGAVLYIMVAGHFPFESPDHENNLTITLQNLQKGRYRRLPSGTSPELCDLIHRTFEPRPDKRITLPELADHPWLAGEEHKTLPAGLVRSSSGQSQKQETWVAAPRPQSAPPAPPAPAQQERRGGLSKQFGSMRLIGGGGGEADGAGRQAGSGGWGRPPLPASHSDAALEGGAEARGAASPAGWANVTEWFDGLGKGQQGGRRT